jgi:predicted DNA-binding transcriptional regulator AlpA
VKDKEKSAELPPNDGIRQALFEVPKVAGQFNRLNKLYRLRDLPQFVGLRRTQIAELIKAGQFPKPILLSDSGRAVAWLEDDLIAWQNARIAARNAETK